MRQLLILFLSIFVLYSCNKDEALTTETTENVTQRIEKDGKTETGIKGGDEGVRVELGDISTSSVIKAIEIENGMLVFTDVEHLRLTVEGLFAKLEAHENAFIQAYGHLSDDEMDAMEEQIGWHEHQPLIDFEQHLNFRSRRQLVEEQVEVWLDNEELDFNNNPDNIDSMSPEFRAVLNKDGKVKIGRDVWDVNEEGGKNDEACCWTNKDEERDGFYRDDTRKWYIKSEADWWPHLAKVHCKTCNYKRRNNGRWKKHRTRMTAQINGTMFYQGGSGGIFGPECGGTFGHLGATKSKRTKCLHVRDRHWLPPGIAYQDLRVCGSGNYNNNEVFETVCVIHCE